MDLIEAKDVCGDLPDGWEEQVLAAPKWSVKKERLDELLASLAAAPKVKCTARTSEITKLMKKLCQDANIVVVSLAVKGAL